MVRAGGFRPPPSNHLAAAVRSARSKEAVNLRLDADVLDYFRQTGPGWQSRINEALRKAAGL